MSSRPKHSIITPTYQRHNMLRLQHRAISEQTERDFEWLILDDSPEPSAYFSNLTDDRVHYRHVAHRMSIGAKRNSLNEEARGEIILHFDDDDYYGKTYLATMAECFNNSIDMAKLSGWYLYSQNYRELGYWDLSQMLGLHLCWSRQAMISVEFGDAYAKESGPKSLLGFGFTYAYRRDIWKAVKFLNQDFGEDIAFVEAVLKCGGRLHQFADRNGICVHVLHKANTSFCYPQYRLPPFMIKQILPEWSMEILGADINPAESIVAVPIAEGVEEQPTAGAKTIGLCMIVKNETRVIRRCLESTLPLVDYILVVDTGSTDGTQQMIHDFLAEHKIKGAVIDEPWRDFAHNRSFALERLRQVDDVDYAMIIDADDTLELDASFDPRAFKAQMTHDLYDVPVCHGIIAHHRAQLFSNRLPFFFKGAIHEYLEAPPGSNLARTTINGFAIRATTGGARSQNPRKYQDDADVLERALATETDPFLISRYTFYLAQSYKDCGEKEKALANYMKRAELGFWNEELYVTLLEAGNLMAALDRPFDEVIAAWERATQIVPTRAEALHGASRYCRNKGKNAEGMEFARRGIDLMQPNGLFVQPWVYDYGILDEFAINAYWAGAYRESLDASLKLLASDKLPPSMVKRIAANARFAADKMPASEPPNLGTLAAEDLVTQHTLVPQRLLRSRVKDSPRVMVAILAKQKEPALPLYLDCIEALDYPKSSIVLYIRTNNNTDKTEKILRDWVARVGHLYHSVEFDASDIADRVEQYREHEWNATRFSVLGSIRNQSMRRACELECDFYFVADVDNFIRTATLRELVALDLPITAPLLRSIAPGQFYSNYHAEIDANGYYENCDQYFWILSRYVRGVLEVPVVHCTYLVRTDVIPELTYEDASRRHEYVVFSDSARKAGIPQYFDNRQVYGYITFGEGEEQHVSGGIEQARALLRGASDTPILTIGDQQCKRLATSAETAVSSRTTFPETHQDNTGSLKL